MSREIALANIGLETAPRWAHTDYSLGYHTDFFRKKTGLEPGDPEGGPAFDKAVGMDYIWSMHEGLNADWGARGRVTDMGHAEYASDGSDKHEPAESPFKTLEEVWAFDPIEEYGLPDFDAQVAEYEDYAVKARENRPDILMSGGYYRTIVSGAISTFGWDMLLMGASDADKMEKVFDGFFRWTKFHMDAWAQTSIQVINQHDDFVWSEGAFMHPEYYRKVIIPRYAELWKPLREAGKKIIFTSDGNFMEFAEDILDAGADALCFEPCNDFEFMAERCGPRACLIGSAVDCRDMAMRPWEVTKEKMDRTFELANKHCKGLILAVGNHIPPNVPGDILDRYITYLMENWSR
ncbi:MAG: hypothetical protein HQ559_17620 [Lentisphaerae bacterium]|nr:hypothetical protein [Lentisphaerota bacterium]